ncbi:MAG: spondin domain-containing protein [Paracoccaceae bacterium]
MHSMKTLAVAVAAGLAIMAPAGAGTIRVTIENTQPVDGVHLTPLWVGFHDGTSFDAFDVGAAASAGVEAVAELGTVGQIGAELADAQPSAVGGAIGAPGGFGPAPIIEPGETASADFTLDRGDNRFFQFLSMILPSNDNFIGNPDPIALFDEDGGFTNPGPIAIASAIAFDAGTEANDLDDGPAFVVGEVDVEGTETPGGTIQPSTGIGAIGAGVGLPNGVVIDPDAFAAFFDGSAPIGTITVSQVPLPPSVAPMLLLAAGAGVAAWRRRG